MDRYRGEASRWTTATPVVFPGHDHRRGQPRPQRSIRRLLRHAGIAESLLESVTMEPGAKLPGSERPARYRAPRARCGHRLWPRPVSPGRGLIHASRLHVHLERDPRAREQHRRKQMCPAASKADVHVVGTNRHAAMRRYGGTGEDGAAPREQCERRARREPGKLPSQQTAAALDTNSVQADRIRADSHFNETPADHRGSPSRASERPSLPPAASTKPRPITGGDEHWPTMTSIAQGSGCGFPLLRLVGGGAG